MLYFNTNSRQKIVHTAACFHILHTDIERIGSFDTPMQAVKCGYRFCKHCNRLAQQYRREEPAILNACLRLGLSVQMCAACIEIVSPFSRWKLLMDETGRGLDLYHQNTVNWDGSACDVVGYHLQGDARKQNIVDFLSYIAAHDVFRKHNPISKRPQPKPEKAPPKKGTRRYKSAQKRAKKEARKRAIGNVMSLFEQLHAPCQTLRQA